jgi:tetratricopeptide (TPR) repeat protein
MRLFANMSLSDKTIKVPDLTKSDAIQKTIFDLLTNANESVKKKLAEMRKKNMVLMKKETKKPKKKVQFNFSEELRLLGEFKKYYNRPIDRNYTLIQLQDFYYKNRELDDKYLQKCIKYCYADIETLEELNKAYIKDEIDWLKKIADLKPKKELENEISEIKQKQFYYNIPAFKRLAIIYEKSKQYDYAIDICKQAVKYYSERGVDSEELEKRLMKLSEKTK